MESIFIAKMLLVIYACKIATNLISTKSYLSRRKMIVLFSYYNDFDGTGFLSNLLRDASRFPKDLD